MAMLSYPKRSKKDDRVRAELAQLRAEKARLAAENAQLHADNGALKQREYLETKVARLGRHLEKHTWQWFWFMLELAIDATNYQAEQALRPAIVNRKVWGGNRTDIGKNDQNVLMSVLETLRRQGRQLIDFFSDLLRGCAPQLLPYP